MARILRQVTVARDGWHNAFTDLQYWRGLYWVSYRRGAAHVSMDGEGVVSVSADGHRFRVASTVKVADDCRDPKILPMGEDRMAAYFPTWVGGSKRRRLQQYVAFTADGFSWSTPQPILDVNHWLWRVVPFGGKYYGACYRFWPERTDPRAYVTELMVSDDMIHWEKISRVGDDSMSLGESGMHFFPDGELWMVTRRNREPHTAVFSVAKPPYTSWENVDLGVLIHSPVILEHEGVLYVAGRRDAKMEGDSTHGLRSSWGVGVWRLDRGKVTPVLRIPATGDCAYPGLIKDPDGRICMSYYSQHAYDLGVLNRPCREGAKEQHAVGDLLGVADVYFAELELP